MKYDVWGYYTDGDFFSFLKADFFYRSDTTYLIRVGEVGIEIPIVNVRNISWIEFKG